MNVSSNEIERTVHHKRTNYKIIYIKILARFCSKLNFGIIAQAHIFYFFTFFLRSKNKAKLKRPRDITL